MATLLETPPAPLVIAATNGSAWKVWHPSAPHRVRQAFRAGNPARGWADWADHLASRREPVPLARLLPGASWPLAWALPDGLASSDTPEWLARLRRITTRSNRGEAAQELLQGWLAENLTAAAAPGHALEALAWCHAMPRLASLVPCEVWWQLLDHLRDASDEAARLDSFEAPLVHQLLAGELGLTLAYLLPELAPCRKLAAPARKALSSGLVTLLDDEGFPRGPHIHGLRPLLACWTRCRAIGKRLPQDVWKGDAERRYPSLLRAALRLTRRDGRQALSTESADGWCKDLFKTALELGDDQENRLIAALALPDARKFKTRRRSVRALPPAAKHSERAAVTVLRPGWRRTDPRLTAVYPGRDLDIELEAGSEVLWSGRWQTEIRCDSQPAQPVSDWEEVCWVSDEDVDYLELEIQLSGGLRLDRHLLLARQGRFLLVADSVLGQQPVRLDYRSVLPLSKTVAFQPADETHEGYLVGKKRRALVLPLGLPEWRCDPRTDRLAATERGLELEQTVTGRCLFAPLWFDLDARRMNKPLTWRPLTVAENLQAVSPEIAVGYRVMVGKNQWLIYRSLAPPGNRTLLGHNLSTQMLVAAFDAGEVETLVAIE